MPNIYKGDIGFKGKQAAIIQQRNIGDELNFSVNSGNLLLTDSKTGEMFSYEDEPDKLHSLSKGRLEISEPALHCPTCASRMISYVRGKRKISIPFCPIHGHDTLERESHLTCNAYRNDAVRHFEAENFEAELTGSDFYPVGEGRIIGAITGDSQFSPLGANAEEDVYYSERQTTDFGMVGSGNDFAQNRAEMMSGRNMWVTTAMLAIGFVAGIAFKDMKQDTTSE